MTIESDRIKTSLFLTLLMILTPFAAASTVTTFSDGSSEVVIEFKDGVNSVNNTDGGFFVPTNETITHASVNVSTSVLTVSDNNRVGVESGLPIWNPVLNNGATSFSNESRFVYEDDNQDPLPVSLYTPSFVTDFEASDEGMLNNSLFIIENPDTGKLKAWEYGFKGGRSITAGPDNCASGDMCWGTNFYDSDYTDDSLDDDGNSQVYNWFMDTPPIYLDNNLNNSILSFSSWHSLRTDLLQNGDNTFSDCAYMEIRTSSTGTFSDGNSGYSFLPIYLPEVSGISPNNGMYQRLQSASVPGKINAYCNGIPTNSFGLAGTSISTANSGGWATIAANLAGHLGTYVQIRFVLESSDSNYQMTNSDKSGWYIDNLMIGDGYQTAEHITIKNIQPSLVYEQKQPNGYGIIDLDAFIPGDSQISVDIVDSSTNILVNSNGNPLTGISSPVIDLWGVDVDDHPFIDIRIQFNPSQDGVSTPVLFGYNIGTTAHLSFNDVNEYRSYNVSRGILFINSSETKILTLSSENFLGENKVPIYSIELDGLQRSNCTYNATLNTPELIINSVPVQGSKLRGFLLSNGSNTLPNPVYNFDLSFEFYGDCVISDLSIVLGFGHILRNPQIDFYNDGIIDWQIESGAFGTYGFQNNFMGAQTNIGIMPKKSTLLELDASTGKVTEGFMLLPQDAEIEYLNLEFSQNSIYSNLDATEGFKINITTGLTSINLGTFDYETQFSLVEKFDTSKLYSGVTDLLSNPGTPIFYTDDYGMNWVRIGFEITQENANTGASVQLLSPKIIYKHSHTLSTESGFENSLREFIAKNLQSNTVVNNLIEIPVTTYSEGGGQLTLSNLSIITEPGYASSLNWNYQSLGLYPNGQIYEIVSTHEVEAITGSALSQGRLRFSFDNTTFFLTYDNSQSSFGKTGDDINRITLLPSSNSANYGNNGGKQLTWKFLVNGAWNDTSAVSIFSETIADNGVIATFGGILLDPVLGNAVENDAGITEFSIFNTAGVEQELDDVNSNQEINLVGKIRLEELDVEFPDPNSYRVIIEQRGIAIEGENTVVVWNEIANRSGFIGGNMDWNVNFGLFASGEETYRLRLVSYENGEIICPPQIYQPDSTCAIQFDVSIDILNPKLLGLQLYKRQFGTGDPSLDSNWRTVFDDSWADSRDQQSFRIIASDIPNPPETATLHVWVEYDNDDNQNGIPDVDEYQQILVNSDGQSPNATYSGVYNDKANDGRNGRVSLWIESYDLAGNPIDGGGPGFDNDIVTYVSMPSQVPSLTSFQITDGKGEPLLDNIPNLPPIGVGAWNQTMFAGNVYYLDIEGQDGNGWKDVEYIEIDLGVDVTGYSNTKVMYFPRNNTAWTDSTFYSVITDEDGESMATIRTLDDNLLFDPFTSEFKIRIPISIGWGLPLDGPFTPTFKIKDLTGNPVDNAGQLSSWRYADDMRLDVRSDSESDGMLSPTFVDTFEPIAPDVTKGSVYPGDEVLFSGQYSFTSGMLDGVFINPEIPLTMEITRQEAFRDAEKGYIPVDEEITLHDFNGGKFDIEIKVPGFQNEYIYTFRLINLPVGAEDLTTAYCFGSTLYGCGQFTIKVDSEPPQAVLNSWNAERGELPDTDNTRFLLGNMPTSTYRCVDFSLLINEKGSLFEDEVSIKWKYYLGDPSDGVAWSVYQLNFGNEPLSTEVELTPVGVGITEAAASCVDLWPIIQGQFDVTESDLAQAAVSLVIWVEAVDGSGSPIELGGNLLDNGGALGIQSADPKHQSTYSLIYEKAKFEVRNLRITPESPQVGDSLRLEVELINTGSIAGFADLEVKSVTNNGVPVFEGYINSEEIGILQSNWVSLDLEEFTTATTGMYYIVYDNETGDVLFNGKSEGKTFNVKVSNEGNDGFSTSLIVIILIGVIAILAVVVVVISRRDRGDDFDDEFETDYEEDKSYASIPPQTQTYAAPAAAVSPEMAEALEKFNFWTQEEIQGYFDQGWSVQQLEEWLENQ